MPPSDNQKSIYLSAQVQQAGLFFVSLSLVVAFSLAVAPPSSFPTGSIIAVPEGVGLYALGEQLKGEKVIRSPFWFRTAAILLGGEHDMKAGQYYFPRPQNLFFVAWRIF